MLPDVDRSKSIYCNDRLYMELAFVRRLTVRLVLLTLLGVLIAPPAFAQGLFLQTAPRSIETQVPVERPTAPPLTEAPQPKAGTVKTAKSGKVLASKPVRAGHTGNRNYGSSSSTGSDAGKNEQVGGVGIGGNICRAGANCSTPPEGWDANKERIKEEIAEKQSAVHTAASNATALRDQQQADAAAERALLPLAIWLVGGVAALFTLLFGIVIVVLMRAMRALPVAAQAGLDPSLRDIPVSRLPLGLPDGSVRAIISLFIVVIGFLILAFQQALKVETAAAISGFIGAIISFYFATRNEATTRDSAVAANQALTTATQAAATANAAAGQASVAVEQSKQMQTDLRTVTAGGTIVVTGANGGAAGGTTVTPPPLTLQALTSDLTQVRTLVSAVQTMPTGTGPISGVDDVLQRIDMVLAAARPLLAGGADAAAVGAVVDQATALLKDVTSSNPVVSTITGALASVAKAAADNVLVGQLLAGVGGPVGLVTSLIFSGIQLFRDQAQFDAWKKAVLAQPFDADALSTNRSDPTMAQAVAALCPLTSLVSDAEIQELYRICLVPTGQAPATAEEIAVQLAEANAPLFVAFGSDAKVLADAITEYRTALVSFNAAKTLPPTIAADPAPGAAPVDTKKLVTAVASARQEPGAAGALDQLISVIEALGAHAGGPNLAPLLSGAIVVSKDVLQILDGGQ